MPENAPQTETVLALDGARLDALELILGGLVAPIDGYCLPDETPEGWPFAATLEVSASALPSSAVGSSLVLTDADGTPLARVTVTGCAPVEGRATYVAGRVSPLKAPEHPPARELRLSAAETLSGSTVALFAGLPDAANIARAVVAAQGGPLVFLAVAAERVHNDYTILQTLAVLRRCSDAVPGSAVRFLAAAALNPAIQAPDVVRHILDRLSASTVLDFTGSEQAAPQSAPAEAGGGRVVLLTGLSGSGKSTVARALMERLSEEGRRAVLLDGDDVRRVLSAGLGFSQADREANLKRIGWVAARIASVGGLAICAPIAPFASTRAQMRAMAEEVGRFVLVHVATPLEVCERRDRKGLYARARAGEIRDFTGIDSPYEVPTNADAVVDTSMMSIEQSVDAIEAVL